MMRVREKVAVGEKNLYKFTGPAFWRPKAANYTRPFFQRNLAPLRGRQSVSRRYRDIISECDLSSSRIATTKGSEEP